MAIGELINARGIGRATLVSRDELFEKSDILTIHLVLSSRTRSACDLFVPQYANQSYVTQGLYKTFYEDTVSNIRNWLDVH